jgi:meiotically up-regulated gene 157 (Mug157) protein
VIQLKVFGDFQNWVRPSATDRAFNSPELDSYLYEVAQKIKNLNIRQLFINTFANTLDTTAYNYLREGKNHTYIITGDIEAMWLRDSTAQVWHYLPLAKKSKDA